MIFGLEALTLVLLFQNDEILVITEPDSILAVEVGCTSSGTLQPPAAPIPEIMETGVVESAHLSPNTSVTVPFGSRLPSVPRVLLGLSMLDISGERNTRIRGTVQRITEDCASLTISSWGDSTLFYSAF